MLPFSRPLRHARGMPFEFKLQRRIEFSETDAAGIVHFSNFFRYMESVEHAFFRSLGHSVMWHHHQPPLGFPRVHAECDYQSPLRFEDLLELHLLVREKRPRSLSYQIRFRNLSRHPAREAARGVLTVVCVSKNPDGTFTPTRIPSALAELIQVAPPETLA